MVGGTEQVEDAALVIGVLNRAAPYHPQLGWRARTVSTAERRRWRPSRRVPGGAVIAAQRDVDAGVAARPRERRLVPVGVTGRAVPHPAAPHDQVDVMGIARLCQSLRAVSSGYQANRHCTSITSPVES